MSKVTYVAMDVHLNSIAAVWGQPKETPRHLVIDNTPEGWDRLQKAVGPGEIWGMYEASSCGFEIYDEFTRRGWKMSVVAPTHIVQSAHSRKRKTDLRDARRLWDILVAHGELGTEMTEVWIPSLELRQQREVVRRRLKLGENVTRTKNSIHGFLRMHQIKRPKEIKTLWSRQHVSWLEELTKDCRVSGHLQTVLGSYVRELIFWRAELAQAQAEVERLAEDARYQKAVDNMTQLDGVGILTAMVFLLELGDVRRFRNRRQVASYLGLVPSSFESGQADDRKGHISRMGPPRIRKVLNQAAWTLVRKDATWRSSYGPLAERRGGRRAIVAIMRRLGIELWHRAQAA